MELNEKGDVAIQARVGEISVPAYGDRQYVTHLA